MSFSDEPRPPAAVPGAAGQTPRWPITQPVPTGTVTRDDLPEPDAVAAGFPQGCPIRGRRRIAPYVRPAIIARAIAARCVAPALRLPQALCVAAPSGRASRARLRRKLAL